MTEVPVVARPTATTTTTTATTATATPLLPRPRRAPVAGAQVSATSFAHLSLAGLRAYRGGLVAEESRVSYWRRLVSVRLDLVRAGPPASVDAASLAVLLHEGRATTSRKVMVVVEPDDVVPPLPDLAALWAASPTGDPGHDAALARRLASAEAQLSAYRASLHRRLTAATAELVRRFTEDPSLCLTALEEAVGRATPPVRPTPPLRLTPGPPLAVPRKRAASGVARWFRASGPATHSAPTHSAPRHPGPATSAPPARGRLFRDPTAGGGPPA